MANEVELERMVVRLIGDAEEYLAMLEEAERATEETAERVETLGEKVEAFGQKMEKVGKTLSLAVTAPITAFGTLATVAHGVQEEAEVTLRGIIEANERGVAGLFEDYAQFASGLQQVTVVGDETTLAMFRTAESLGVTGEAAKTAIKESMGLAAALGMSAQSGIRYTAMLAQGDATMLSRYIPTLRSIEDPLEKVAEAHRVLGNMFAVAEAKALTFTGSLQQLWNDTGDLHEQYGKIIAERIQPFIASLRNLVTWLQSFSEETKTTILVVAGLAAAIGPVLLGLGTLIKLMPLVVAGFTLITAHPIVALLVVLTGAIVALANEWANLNRIIAEGNQLADKSADNIKVLIQGFREQAEELRKLAELDTLNLEQVDRAETLIGDLEGEYEGLGITLDRTTGKIKGMDDGLAEIERRQRRGIVIGLEQQLISLQDEFDQATINAEKFLSKQAHWRKEQTRITDALRETRTELGRINSGGDLPGTAGIGADDSTGLVGTGEEATQKAQEMLRLLEEQSEVQGLSADRAKLFALERAGAAEDDIAWLREKIELMEKENDKLEANKTAEAERKNIVNVLKQMEDQAQTAFETLHGADTALREFTELGPTPEQVAKFKSFREELEGFEMETQGRRLIEQFATPFDIAKKKIEEYIRLRKVGAIGEKTFAAATEASLAEFKKASEKVEERITPEAVQTISRGSVAERLLIQESRLAMTVREPTKAQEDSTNLKDTAKNTEGIKDLLQIIEARGGPLAEPAGFEER